MTKYILAGGNDLGSSAYGPRLAKEVYETVERRPVRILSCFFATPLEYQGKAAETWRPWFARNFGSDIEWTYAVPHRFEDQAHSADLIYLHGGDNDLLLQTLGGYSWLPAAFEGKVVIGSSAGANYLSRHFWARRRQQIMPGAGIVQSSVIVHYGSEDPEVPQTDWTEVENRLTQVDGEKPLKIREGHFWVIDDDHHGN